MLWLRSDCMSSRLLVRLFSALALAAIALISAPLAARADTGNIYSWRFNDANGRTIVFQARPTLESAAIHDATSSGSAGASSITNGRIGDVSLSGSTGSMAVTGSLGDSNFIDGSFLGQRYLNSVNVAAFWLRPTESYRYLGLTDSHYDNGTLRNFYIRFPSYLSQTSPTSSNGTTPQNIPISGHLSGSSLNGGLGSRSINASIDSSNLNLSDTNGFTLAGTLGARSLSLASSASSTSALTTCDFISTSSGNMKVNQNSVYSFSCFLPNPSNYSAYLGTSSFDIYRYDGVRSTRIANFGITSISVQGFNLVVEARCYVSYDGAVSDAVCSLPLHYGIGVTQASYLNAVTNQTNSINQTATNNSNREISTYMDTTGSNTVVGDVLGGTSSSDMSDSMGVGDALGIASGGLSSMLGRSASGVVSFSGLQLGAEYGNFEIPAFSVDIWSWCPEGLATTIKTCFTAVAVISWAVGMKRFFDRIFHGEQVVSVE